MSRCSQSYAAAMSKLVAASIAAVAGACGPDLDIDEDEPPGVLEYEHPEDRFYRLDRRVDIVPVDPAYSSRECGYLTDRAYDDLVTTLDALEPAVDYNDYPCREIYDPQGRVHLEGFEHSPFVCDWDCCHPDLGMVSFVYFVVENNFVGIEPVWEGVPYVAIEPDRPCE